MSGSEDRCHVRKSVPEPVAEGLMEAQGHECPPSLKDSGMRVTRRPRGDESPQVILDSISQ